MGACAERRARAAALDISLYMGKWGTMLGVERKGGGGLVDSPPPILLICTNCCVRAELIDLPLLLRRVQCSCSGSVRTVGGTEGVALVIRICLKIY